MLYYKQRVTGTQFCCMVFGIFPPGKLLQSSKAVVADPLPNHLPFGLWSPPVNLLSSPEGGRSDMGTVNNSNKIRYMLLFV